METPKQKYAKKMIWCGILMLLFSSIQFWTREVCPVVFYSAFGGWCIAVIMYIVNFGKMMAVKEND